MKYSVLAQKNGHVVDQGKFENHKSNDNQCSVIKIKYFFEMPMIKTDLVELHRQKLGFYPLFSADVQNVYRGYPTIADSLENLSYRCP